MWTMRNGRRLIVSANYLNLGKYRVGNPGMNQDSAHEHGKQTLYLSIKLRLRLGKSMNQGVCAIRFRLVDTSDINCEISVTSAIILLVQSYE